MKIISTKTLLQTMAVLLTSIVLLGCPIDDEDIFTGDVTIVNNTVTEFDLVAIEEAGTGPGTHLGNLAGNGGSVTYSGYDCITSYTNTVKEIGGVNQTSAAFIPPCGGTETVTWN